MTVDGKTIRDEIIHDLKKKVRAGDEAFSLALFVPENPDFATQSFIKIKRKIAQEVGVQIAEHTLTSEMTTDEAIEEISCAARDHQGIILQLPTSAHIDADRVRNAIPITHDVDGVSDSAIHAFERGETEIVPPVIGAIAEIISQNSVDIVQKKVVVVGKGKLVGKPGAVWFTRMKGNVTVLDKHSPDMDRVADADILLLGAGVPCLIQPEMIKEGVLVFDAGTSEAEGKLAGDADPSCAEKSALFTPVPGGIGPIAVAMIFKNLLALAALPKIEK